MHSTVYNSSFDLLVVILLRLLLINFSNNLKLMFENLSCHSLFVNLVLIIFSVDLNLELIGTGFVNIIS